VLLTRVRILKPGWFMANNGKPVAIQYWDYQYQPYKDAHWRGMAVLETKNGLIRDWECLWYDLYGDGYFPGYRVNMGDWDLVRELEPHEIPATKPEQWMPEYYSKKGYL